MPALPVPTPVLAVLLGAAAPITVWCLIAGVRGRPAMPARPDSRIRRHLGRLRNPRLRRRLLTAAGGGVMMLALTGWPVAAVSAGAAICWLPRLVTGRPARQRIARLEALESWTRRLADVLGASRGLEDALIHSTASAPEPIAAPVQALARRLSVRMPADQALLAFAHDLDDPVGDRIAAALVLAASRRGRGLRPVLTNLAAMVAQDVAARREIEAERATHRVTLRWLAAFLIGYTVFAALQDSYAAPYDTLPGQAVLAMVAALYAAGLWWMHRLAAAAPAGRFLSGGDGAEASTASSGADPRVVSGDG
ncbi:type II secretion system F family protein [Spongiactinospora rosea]|nr:type II secretion system F family protein [Spongiactinospora rosea]